jgi:hypothetical protein
MWGFTSSVDGYTRHVFPRRAEFSRNVSVHSHGGWRVNRTVLVLPAMCVLMSIGVAGTQSSSPVARSAGLVEVTPMAAPVRPSTVGVVLAGGPLTFTGPSVSAVEDVAAEDAAANASLTQGTLLLAAAQGPTSWAALNRAIGRIPNYRPGVATWTVTARFGHWGTTDLSNGRVYISPSVPASRLYSVVAHEYGHALASKNWGRNWRAADVAMNRWFGASTPTGRERAADCMALVQGATWTNYTSCTSTRWRQGARILLAGRRLP